MKLTNMEALQAQGALARLMEMDLPIKASLDTALISNMVDEQVKAFVLVRNRLFKTYSIKTEPGEKEGSVNFSSTTKGETDEETVKLQSENLEAFSEKLNELLEAKTEDLNFKKIQLPSDITIKPEILKSLVEFVSIA